VNYPLAYFAERIAGDQARVVFPAPSAVDPAFWQPDRETIHAYQQADLILLNGADYASWVSKVSLPRLRTVDTSASFSEQLIKTVSAVSHSHGGGEKHRDTSIAFTTWLDFPQSLMQATSIADALIRKRPQYRDQFEQNLHQLEAELLDLDRQLKAVVARQPSLPLFASHPVYQYLARRYRLNLQTVMWEADEFPDETQWKTLAEMQLTHPAKWMLWEANPVPQSVTQLQNLGIGSLVFMPLANKPASGDFISIMRENLKNLEKAFAHF
jgi:zinc transport system substrate-binding protein